MSPNGALYVPKKFNIIHLKSLKEAFQSLVIVFFFYFKRSGNAQTIKIITKMKLLDPNL
jgi:hypothetical protein